MKGEMGERLKEENVERRIEGENEGDVIIQNIKKKKSYQGEGVEKGIMDLKEKGMKLVRMKDVKKKMEIKKVKEKILM